MTEKNNQIRILVVENDPIYAETIRLIIEKAGYDLMGVTDNAKEALQLVNKFLPDLILLDIYLSDGTNGIELMKQINPDIPVIVITSNRDQQTFNEIKAFRPFVILLKPFDSVALSYNVELVLANQSGKKRDNKQNEDFLLRDSFFIKEKKTLIKVPIRDIQYIQSEDKYCTLYTERRKFVIRIPLRELIELLPDHFTQIHRSYVVDIHQIDQIHLDDFMLEVAGDTVPIGATYKQNLLSLFRKL